MRELNAAILEQNHPFLLQASPDYLFSLPMVVVA
jgi:hypothetical protein